MKLMNIINEIKNQTYDYGCAMLYFNFPEIEYIHNLIDPSHLYTEDLNSYGLETEPHTTLLYGLHSDVCLDDVKGVIEKHTFHTCRVHNPSLFQNQKYDVLKFDVNGPSLHDANNDLKKFPFTSDFPDYHPHLTIAYLKPGYGNRYVRKLTNLQYMLKPIHGIYSESNGTKTKIDLRIND
jgi:hypothetical protein